jgi:hypothetical protein
LKSRQVDWSSIMSALHKSLRGAEQNLRLIHMDEDYLTFAKNDLLEAQRALQALIEWVDV